MFISLVLAWVSVLLCILTALKYIVRTRKNKTLNRFFRKLHIPSGTLLLIVALLHGILAGNPSFATLADFDFAPVLLTLNLGTACYVLIAVLAFSYMLRKKLKKNWMTIHRVATVLLLAVLILHIVNVGVRLPSQIFDSNSKGTITTEASAQEKHENTVLNTTAPGTQEEVGAEAAPEIGQELPEKLAEEIAQTVTFSDAQLQDGVYEGSADGYHGPITVSVTVENGSVTGIYIVSSSDTSKYLNRAQSILTEITDGQSLKVDAVTGATYSSNGLKNATYNALQGAVSSEVLNIW